MRILIVTQWFEPEPIIKGLVLAKALTAQGHEVRVLTGFPNYPGGKVYSGYKVRLLQREVMEGIPVTRVPLYPNHGQSKIGRILNYASFGFSALVYGTFSGWRPDVMYVYHPPITTAIAGALISAVRGVPFALDVQDLWPDTLKATGMMNNERVLSLVGVLMRWAYRRAHAILPQSEGFKTRMAQAGIPAEKIHVVPNWCHEDALGCRPAAGWQPPAALANKFTVGFAGNIGMAQAVDSLLDAAALIQPQRPDIQFFFVGGGTEVARLQQKAETMQLTNVIFIPAMPMQEVGALLDVADGLIVHLRADPLFAITIPAKTQAYMFAGKPIIMAVAGDATELVQRAQAGVLAAPENPRAIADAILELAAMTPEQRKAMGKRGRQYYQRELSIAAATAKIAAALEAITKK